MLLTTPNHPWRRKYAGASISLFVLLLLLLLLLNMLMPAQLNSFTHRRAQLVLHGRGVWGILFCCTITAITIITAVRIVYVSVKLQKNVSLF
jgi:hypothetical protein